MMEACRASELTKSVSEVPKTKPRAAVALGLPFPRLLHANLAYNQSGSAWQDRGDKMAVNLKWARCCSEDTAGVEQYL